MRLEHLDHVALRVTDVARSVAWYRDVLGLEREPVEEWGDLPVILKVGEASLALFQAADPSMSAAPADSIRMLHVAFRLDADGFRQAREELEGNGHTPEFQDHDICHSLYLRDPDGHLVEITTYEIEPTSRAAQPGTSAGTPAPAG